MSLNEHVYFWVNPPEVQKNQLELCMRAPVVWDAHNSYLTPKLGFQGRNFREMQSTQPVLRQKPGTANSVAGSRTSSLWASSLWGGASARQPSELPQPQAPQVCVPYTAAAAPRNFKQYIAFKSSSRAETAWKSASTC